MPIDSATRSKIDLYLKTKNIILIDPNTDYDAAEIESAFSFALNRMKLIPQKGKRRRALTDDAYKYLRERNII